MRISNWLIHGWSARGGAGRWSGLDYATTNGSGSRTFCLGVKDTWAAPLKIIDCSSKRFSTALGLGVRGGIYLSVSATGNRSIKHYRAIATRYDKLARNFLAAVQLVAAIILLN